MSAPAATSHGISQYSKNASNRPQARSQRSSAAEPARRIPLVTRSTREKVSR